MSLTAKAATDFDLGHRRAAESEMDRVAFFHQNDVFSAQGGIERYVSTLCEANPQAVALISVPSVRTLSHHLALKEGTTKGPRWIGFLRQLFAQRRQIKQFLRAKNVKVMEFSRPEYLLAGWMFPGKRVVTIHGTGPAPEQKAHYLLHHACCLLLPFLAHRVQIVGRDPSGVPALARKLLGPRIVYIDAWRDDCFVPSALAPLSEGKKLKVFYAGRIAPQKNPKLLFDVIRQSAAKMSGQFEFNYFGADYAAFVAEGLEGLVTNHGFMGPQALNEAIASCHFGLMCSAYGEGSPYIVVEALSCGRPFVLPSLPTLVSAYTGFQGAVFVPTYETQDYLSAMSQLRADLISSRLDPFTIAAPFANRSKSEAAAGLIQSLARL